MRSLRSLSRPTRFPCSFHPRAGVTAPHLRGGGPCAAILFGRRHRASTLAALGLELRDLGETSHKIGDSRSLHSSAQRSWYSFYSFMKSGVLNTQLFSSTRRRIRQPALVRTYSSTYQSPSMNTWDPPLGSGISCGLKHITRPVARSPSTWICTFAFECCVLGNIGMAFLRNAIV